MTIFGGWYGFRLSPFHWAFNEGGYFFNFTIAWHPPTVFGDEHGWWIYVYLAGKRWHT